MSDYLNPKISTAFTEFFGDSSFAGGHVLGEPKQLKLFDVYLFKKGLMKPRQFVKTFGDSPRRHRSCTMEI